MMLEELQRRNYSKTTVQTYLKSVQRFAEHFHTPPDRLGLEHIRSYQAYLFQEKKLAATQERQAVLEGIVSSEKVELRIRNEKSASVRLGGVPLLHRSHRRPQSPHRGTA